MLSIRVRAGRGFFSRTLFLLRLPVEFDAITKRNLEAFAHQVAEDLQGAQK